MTILIVYGSIEGQTAKIARFAADHLTKAGHDVALIDSADDAPPPDFNGIERVILAASVHERRHPRPFEVFLAANKSALADRPSLLISVSLSAAFPDGMEEAADYVADMTLRTGFVAGTELLVAGAVRPSSYDYFATQVVRHVVLRDHAAVRPDEEREFTDWDALAAALDGFAAG
jgi:menaquinone-dependent protoporphyrinogen oxidase